MLSGKIFDAIENQLKGLIMVHEADIHEAYLNKEEDEKLSIRLVINLYPHKERFEVTVVETTLAFTKEKVRDSRLDEIDEKQAELFKAVENLRPKKGSGIFQSPDRTRSHPGTEKP